MSSRQAGGTPEPRGQLPLTRSWLDRSVIALALFSLFAGFGQFGAIAALGDVASTFGHVSAGSSLADRAGLSGSELGLGLAILRLASLAGLPLSGLADRFGRRPMLVFTCGLGLVCTVCAAASPSYWWFVIVFAAGRPFLSATAAITQVDAAEQTDSSGRAKAIALIAGGYGIGAGITALVHKSVEEAVGFRGLFALGIVPLVAIPFVAHRLTDSDRFVIAQSALEHPLPVLGPIAKAYRRRLVVVCSLAALVAFATGPGNSFVFIYADNVKRLGSTAVAVMVLVAALFGLVGLLVGRLLADRMGRRPTAMVCAIAMGGAVVLTYSGSRVTLIVGYEFQIFAASAFAPAAGTLANELFPTAVRASVAGWLVAASVIGATVGLLAFGAIADLGNRFGGGAVATAIPVVLGSGLFFALPETKGKEPEELLTDRS